MKAFVYGYFDDETGDCFYIGIATNSVQQRHQSHIQPSMYNDQEVNKYLQDNLDTWSLITLMEIELKQSIIDDEVLLKKMLKSTIHAVETDLTNEYKPRYNKYLK